MANRTERILFATDFSDCSNVAFRHATMWAQACDAHLDIVHVVEIHPGLDVEMGAAKIYIEEQGKTAGLKLDTMADRARPLVKATAIHLVTGVPVDQIHHIAAERGSDLLVMGTHGWTGLDRVLLGSTAERVVQGAPCPVLTVRHSESPQKDEKRHARANASHCKPAEGSPDMTLPQHVLVPVDFSDCSLEAFEYAVQVAKQCQAAVTLLHVLGASSYSLDFELTHLDAYKQLRQKAESRLGQLTSVLHAQDIQANYRLNDLPAADAILDDLQDVQADLIVMGTHGRRGFSRLLMGNVTSAVLRRAPCPVLTVKSSKFAHGHTPRAHEQGKVAP